jgi:hypothetical protein
MRFLCLKSVPVFNACPLRYRHKSSDEVATFKIRQTMTYLDDNYDEIRNRSVGF